MPLSGPDPGDLRPDRARFAILPGRDQAGDELVRPHCRGRAIADVAEGKHQIGVAPDRRTSADKLASCERRIRPEQRPQRRPIARVFRIGWRRRAQGSLTPLGDHPAERRDLAQARRASPVRKYMVGKEIARRDRAAVAQLGGAERLPGQRRSPASCAWTPRTRNGSGASGILRAASLIRAKVAGATGVCWREAVAISVRPIVSSACGCPGQTFAARAGCSSANCATAAFRTDLRRKQQRRRHDEDCPCDQPDPRPRPGAQLSAPCGIIRISVAPLVDLAWP